MAVVRGCELVLQQPEPAAKKSNWRQKHDDFVRTIRAARDAQAAVERGEPLPPPPPPSINPGPPDALSTLTDFFHANVMFSSVGNSILPRCLCIKQRVWPMDLPWQDRLL